MADPLTSEEAAAAVIDVLEAESIPYMLVGSLATNYYGIPRATQDADFVVHLEKSSIPAIAKCLGPRFRLNPQQSFELATATTRHVLQLVGTPFQVELFLLSEDEHDQTRFTRRRRVRVLDRQAFVPAVEDVIITKLRWSHHAARTKDVEDAERHRRPTGAHRLGLRSSLVPAARHGAHPGGNPPLRPARLMHRGLRFNPRPRAMVAALHVGVPRHVRPELLDVALDLVVLNPRLNELL